MNQIKRNSVGFQTFYRKIVIEKTKDPLILREKRANLLDNYIIMLLFYLIFPLEYLNNGINKDLILKYSMLQTSKLFFTSKAQIKLLYYYKKNIILASNVNKLFDMDHYTLSPSAPLFYRPYRYINKTIITPLTIQVQNQSLSSFSIDQHELARTGGYPAQTRL